MVVNLKHFAPALLLTCVIGGLALAFSGESALAAVAILAVIEVAFGFDNAVVNARVLEKLTAFWQTMFLTIGVLIAVFGMRFLLPIVIVELTSGLGFGDTISLAFNHPNVYAEKLTGARPLIAAFGGAFLLCLALEFFINDRHEATWWRGLEVRLKNLSHFLTPPAIVAAVIMFLALLAGVNGAKVLTAGLLGVGGFMVLKLIDFTLGRAEPRGINLTGWKGLSLFIYLEILDASFSFDSVIGAFAITDKIILIAAGLGAGAVWIRSLTLFMVRARTLKKFLYLEHGAYYTIAALAASLLISLFINVPDLLTGLAAVIIIAAAFSHSIKVNRLKRT